MRRLLVTANVGLSSPILVTLMMKALSSSETSVLTRTAQRNIPEEAILHSHRRENFKSYIISTSQERFLNKFITNGSESKSAILRQQWDAFSDVTVSPEDGHCWASFVFIFNSDLSGQPVSKDRCLFWK
jgi:hypothetical protein